MESSSYQDGDIMNVFAESSTDSTTKLNTLLCLFPNMLILSLWEQN